MRSVVDFVLKNKLATWILSLILIVAGVYSTLQMNKESIPNIDIPYLIVTTVYPGATPETVDKEVSSILETRLKEIDNLENINSDSNQNFSMITLEFEYGSNINDLKTLVQKEIDTVTFKEGIEKPSIMSIDMNTMPVVSLGVSSEKLSIDEMTALIQKELSPKLQDLDGVNNIEVSGLIEEKIVLTFDKKLLDAYQLTEEQLIDLIKANNVNMSIGLVEFDESKEAVAVYGEKDSLENLKSLSLPFPNAKGEQATLKEFATLKLVKEENSISRVNGLNSFSINITKGQEANTVEVAELVKEVTDEFMEKNSEVEVTYVFDQSTEINNSVHTMLNKALFGTLAAIVIILIFLRDIRSTIISVISIPLSLLISAFVLKQLDVTMNLMSLGAMTVAIGRVIDDSIVVVENIFRRLHDKSEPLKGRALIKEATLQMFVPILSSTMVTIAVFLPLMLVGGMVGELFMPFALTMMFSLLASLLVAVTIVPVMAHSMFKKEIYGLKQPKDSHSKPSKLSNSYAKALTWSLNHKVITLFLSFVLVGGSVALIPQLGFGFLNEEETADLTYSYEVENSETEAEIIKALDKAEAYLLNQKEVEIVQATYGSDNEMAALMNSGEGGSITASFKSVKAKNEAKKEILAGLQKLDTKGIWNEVDNASMFSSNEVSYSIQGATLEDLEVASKQIIPILEKEKSIEKVSSTLDEVYKENQFLILDDKIAKHGLTTAQVGMVLYNIGDEKEITSISDKNGKTYKVVTKTETTEAHKLDDLLNRLVGVSKVTNKKVYVKDVVEVKEGSTVSGVTKENGRLIATITGKVSEDGDTTALNSKIEKEIEELSLPAGVEMKTEGTSAQMVEAFGKLGMAMLAAIGIVYFILVLTFKEGLAPFAILFSLPMTIIGVVVALYVTGLTLDISGMLGLLMLIGIVVTNAIVLIDRVLENEYAGENIREALVEAGKTRLRPILMTAIATVTALIPMAIGAESGGLISQGLGVTVIGGLVSSTILTLFIVPVIYEGLSKLFRKDRKNINWD